MTILEESETFLDCVVRERDRLLRPTGTISCVGCREEADRAVPGGIFHGAFFVTREVPLDKVNVTETLKVAEMGELGELEDALTPSALFALESFFGRLPKSHL